MKGKHYSLITLLAVVLVACVTIISVAINNGYEEVVSGSGTIRKTTTSAEGRDMEIAKISFSGKVGYDRNGILAGQWQVNFHKSTIIDGGRFKSTEITELKFKDDLIECLSPSYNVVKFKADGHFNGVHGWEIIVWLTDFEVPLGEIDGARITLYHPTLGTYDSSEHFGGEFYDDYGIEEECPDSWSTNIDRGKLQIH